MAGKRKIIVGARGSLLSIAQANSVIAALTKKIPGTKFRLKKILTLGDRNKSWQRDDTGIFVKEIEEALLSGEIDLAVHSAKDLPSELPAGLKIAAIPRRENPADILISAKKSGLDSLKPGSVIGTSSLRRMSQILNKRPDLIVKDLRGNLDTRIKRLRNGEFDAIILALAGIRRLKIKNISGRILPKGLMLPCAGQGALAVEIRQGDKLTEELAGKINHPPSHIRVSCERAFIRALGAGCRLPVGALAEIKGKTVSLEAKVLSPDGKKVIHLKKSAPIEEAELLGASLAEEAIKKGAKQILTYETQSIFNRRRARRPRTDHPQGG